MSRKYDVRFCKCGHIHVIPTERIQTALEADKNFLLICGSCGDATLIGADIEPAQFWDPNADEDAVVYNMYSGRATFEDSMSVTEDTFRGFESKKAITEVYWDKGVSVPMMTGYKANSFMNGTFYDLWYPTWDEIRRRDVTVPDVHRFIDKYTQDQKTVNMSLFIRQTPDDYLEAISGYIIEGFDWKGTKYDRDTRKAGEDDAS